MPRTSRRTATTGLAWEAVAPIVRWPLHSPRRLAAVLAAVVAIVTMLAAVRPTTAADAAPIASTATSQASAPSSTATTPPTTAPASTSPAGAGAASSPAEVGVRFVTAWARPDLPAEAWHTDVTALATPQFGAALRTVDPRNVPARAVTGSAATTSATGVTAQVRVPTDAGPVVVELAVMGTTWQVSGISPAGPPASRTDGAAASLAATYTPLPVGG